MEAEKKLTGYPSIDKPWLKYYSEETINASLPECTIYEYLKQINADNLSRVCLNYYGNKLTYGKFFKKIDKLASAFENIGVKANDVVTIAMINSSDTICALLALNKIGAVANMVYGISSSEEMQKYLIDAQSTIVVTLDIFQDTFLKIADKAHIKTVIVTNLSESMSALYRIGAKFIKKMKSIPIVQDSRFISWKAFIKRATGISATAHNSKASAVITYTGGTTGGSKGVLLSNEAVLAVATQYILGEKELYRGSKWIQVIPLFVAYGITCSLMIPLIVGMTLIVRIPMSETITQMVKKFKPNHIMYGPAFWEAFADENADLDLSGFIAPITGGDVLHEAIEEKINKYLTKCHSPYMIMNGYGMTEVGAAVSVNYKDKYEFGSVGIPFVKNVISTFDTETGEELTYGQQGEVCICTPTMMSGYVNNPEETDNILRRHSDGLIWVHTGDLGYVTEDGFVHITGRLKRFMLYNLNGLYKKIFSLDIEKVLLKCDIVKNCVVVPKSNFEKNQVPVAFIILNDNINCNDPELILRTACEKQLESEYRPTAFYFVNEFPLTKVGKVDYRALEQQAENKE